MHATLLAIHEQGEQRHKEFIEILKHLHHQDIVELLKRGFGVVGK
jgi:hypothetical protein